MPGRIIRPGASVIRRGGEGIYLPGTSRLGDADASLGTAQPPAGHFFLRGKNADGSHAILRGLTAAPSTYVNLSGKSS